MERGNGCLQIFSKPVRALDFVLAIEFFFEEHCNERLSRRAVREVQGRYFPLPVRLWFYRMATALKALLFLCVICVIA